MPAKMLQEPAQYDVVTATISLNKTWTTAAEPTASSEWDPVFLTYYIICLIFILMILVGNTTTIVLLIRYRSLRTVTNMFAVSLACADIIMAFSVTLYNTINYTPYMDTLVALHYPCAIAISSIVISAGCSHLSLLCIAIDRYIAVLHPLRYPSKMSPDRVKIMIVVLWIYGCLPGIGILAVYQQDSDFNKAPPCSVLSNIPQWYYFGVLLPHVLILNIISKTLYFRTVYVAWKVKRKIQNEQIAFNLKTKISLKETKAAKMMMQILTLFILSWAPYTILHIALYIIGPTAASWLFTALEVSKLLSLSNSYMNPIIYFWKNPDFRVALWACAHCQSQTKLNRVSILSVGEPVSSISNSLS